jgi:hypothetical protein
VEMDAVQHRSGDLMMGLRREEESRKRGNAIAKQQQNRIS